MTSSSSSASKSIISAALFLGGVAAGYGVKQWRQSQAENRSKKDEKVLCTIECEVPQRLEKEFQNWCLTKENNIVNMDGIKGEVYKSERIDKPTVVFVLGGPGAGKGTQCERIVEEFGFVHISAGDCLRAERNRQSADANLINQYIRDGKIVPVEITVRLLLKEMQKSGKAKFLIDGFPRNLDNLEGWGRVVGDSVNVAFVLFLDCPEHVMEERLLSRGKTSGRVDDNLASIKKRFQTYQRETKPIIDTFGAKGKVRQVIADKPVDAVWLQVKSHFNALRGSTAKFSLQYEVEEANQAKFPVTELVSSLETRFCGEVQASSYFLSSVRR